MILEAHISWGSAMNWRQIPVLTRQRVGTWVSAVGDEVVRPEEASQRA